MTAKLVIKSPNQQVEDMTIDCEQTWTVGHLKTHLSKIYPTKPDRDEQKIIYQGKLLKDDLVLKKLINQSEDIQTMHLICPHSTSNILPKQEMKTTEKIPKSETEHNFFPNRFSQQVSNDGQNMYNLNWQSYWMNSNLSASYMAALHQNYQQAMLQHFTRMYQPPQISIQPQNTDETERSNETVQPANNMRPPEPNNNNMQDEEGPEPIDFLDVIYIFTRVAILLAAVLIQTTSDTLYAAVGILIFVLICYACRMLFQNAPSSDQRSTTNAVSANDEQNTAPDHQDAAPHPGKIREFFSKLNVALVFFRTLFTSLIPE